jgi:hypothetical protein
MIRIMSDQDIEGLVNAVLSQCRQADWEQIWNELEVQLVTFSELGLKVDSTDMDIWNCCQEHGIVLLTGNRNAETPDSLETTIREHNLSNSWPVLTFGDLRRLKFDRDYLELAAERLMEKLIDIEALRGTGRLYIP